MEGPKAGVRYDAFHLTRVDGKGTWWEGLDPQQLYTGRNLVMPDGFHSIAEANTWHEANDRKWHEEAPPHNPDFTRSWFLRCKELMDTYQPDLVYFDDDELPLGQAGLDVTAHFYNASIARYGSLQCVVNGKHLLPDHLGAITLDIERGRSEAIRPDPWQTDTCIGDWHYKRSVFEQHSYKSPRTVLHMLIDIVSKNGNLLLSIPVRGDGTIDSDEQRFLEALATWFPANGEAIFGTRPHTIHGEGPPDPIDNSTFNEKARSYTAADLRFTTRGDVLYAIALGWPADGRLTIKSFARGAQHAPRRIETITLLGNPGALAFEQTAAALAVKLPQQQPNQYAYALRISG